MEVELTEKELPTEFEEHVSCEMELENKTPEELMNICRHSMSRVNTLEGELSEMKTQQLRFVPSYREKVLTRRLLVKEQEFQEYLSQLRELKSSQISSAVSLKCVLLDPAVNIILQKYKKEVSTLKANLEETQNELSAWKFTPDSNTGKRLMAKCRLLHQENEELGKVISSGRIAKLEGELALQKSFCEDVKKSQSELDTFLQEMDEDVEGMQGTIYYLQQELKKANEQIANLQNENNELRRQLPPVGSKEPEIIRRDEADDSSSANTPEVIVTSDDTVKVSESCLGESIQYSQDRDTESEELSADKTGSPEQSKNGKREAEENDEESIKKVKISEDAEEKEQTSE